MIAWINGIQVQGSPEEIEKYRQITSEKQSMPFRLSHKTDDVPEHVKKYYDGHKGWKATGETHIRVWF